MASLLVNSGKVRSIYIFILLAIIHCLAKWPVKVTN